MTPRLPLLGLALALLSPLTFADEVSPLLTPSTEQELTADPQRSGLEIFRLQLSTGQGLDFSDTDGSLDSWQILAQGVLAKPWKLSEQTQLVPIWSYQFTQLDLDSAPFSLSENQFHTLTLGLFFHHQFEDPAWSIQGLARTKLASDTLDLDSDSLAADLGLLLNRRWSPTFSTGLGLIAFDLGSRNRLYPGLAFEWTPCDEWLFSLRGPLLKIRRTMTEDWQLSLRGKASGGTWHLSESGQPAQQLHFGTYRLGLYSSHRLHQSWWLEMGAGVNTLTRLELLDSADNSLREDDLDPSLYAEVALSLKLW